MSKRTQHRKSSLFLYLVILVFVLLGVVGVMLSSDTEDKKLKAAGPIFGACSDAVTVFPMDEFEATGQVSPIEGESLGAAKRRARAAARKVAEEHFKAECDGYEGSITEPTENNGGDEGQDPSASVQPSTSIEPSLSCKPDCCSLDTSAAPECGSVRVTGPSVASPEPSPDPDNPDWEYDEIVSGTTVIGTATGTFSGSCTCNGQCVFLTEPVIDGGRYDNLIGMCSDLTYNDRSTPLVSAAGTGTGVTRRQARNNAIENAKDNARPLLNCNAVETSAELNHGFVCNRNDSKCTEGLDGRGFPTTCSVDGETASGNRDQVALKCLQMPGRTTSIDGGFRHDVRVENCSTTCTCNKECVPVSESPSTTP